MAEGVNTPSNSPESEARIIEQQKAVQSIMSKLDRLNEVFRDEQGGLWFANKEQKKKTKAYLDGISWDIRTLEQEALSTHTTIKGLDAVQKTYFEMRTGIGDLYENTSTDLDFDVLYKILAPMNASVALGYLTEIHGKINSNTYQSDELKRRYKEVISIFHKQVLGKLTTVEDKKTFFRIITGRNGGVSDDFKDTVLASQVLLEIENADQSTKEMAANFRGEGWELSDENTITSKNVAKWVGVAAAAVWGTVLAAPVVGATGLGAVATWGVAWAVGWASAATANNILYGKWYESLNEASLDIGSQIALGAVLGAWGSTIQTGKGMFAIGATGGATETFRSATIGWQWLNDWKALAKWGGLGLGIAIAMAFVPKIGGALTRTLMRVKWNQVFMNDVPVGTVAEVKDAINQAGAAANNPEGKKAAEEALKGMEDALNIQEGDYSLKGRPKIKIAEEGLLEDSFYNTWASDMPKATRNAEPGDVISLKNAPWLAYQKQTDGTWALVKRNTREIQELNVSEQEVIDNNRVLLNQENSPVPQWTQTQREANLSFVPTRSQIINSLRLFQEGEIRSLDNAWLFGWRVEMFENNHWPDSYNLYIPGKNIIYVKWSITLQHRIQAEAQLIVDGK